MFLSESKAQQLGWLKFNEGRKNRGGGWWATFVKFTLFE